MRRIGILGDIGSGKTFVAKNFGYPVFNADEEVAKLYKRNREVFLKLNKVLPKFIYSFPIDKNELTKAILANRVNLKKIVKIIHLEVKKNRNKKFIILDVPLLLENKINKKNDILVFVHSNKAAILKKLRKRYNYNTLLLNKFRNLQLPLDYKKEKSHFVLKNNFTKKSVNKGIKKILKTIK